MPVTQDAERVRALLVVVEELSNMEGTAPGSEVWNEVERRFPLNDYEAEPVPSGAGRRGRVNWTFRSDDLRKAGWLLKSPDGDGRWSVTPDGRDALKRLPDATEFTDEARRLANEVNRDLRAAKLEQLEREVVPVDAAQRRVILAAEEFVRRGFGLGDSVFVEGRPLWTREVVDELRMRFPGPADVGSGTFDQRLRLQLNGASDNAKLLMAEVTTLQLLPISGGPGPAAKRSRIQSILDQMQVRVEIPETIAQAFTGGSFNPGQRMLTTLGECIDVLLRSIDAWLGESAEEHTRLLESPLAWRDFVRAVPGARAPAQRNALMYLVHPGYFGPVVSATHKPQILKAFQEFVSAPAEDEEAALHQVLLGLQVRDGRTVDLYRPPYRDRWKVAEKQIAPDPDPERAPDSDEEPAAEHSPSDLAKTLHYDVGWVEDVLRLLGRRKQIILTGPPGTGKTYAARRIAEHVAGGKSGVQLVQFHPSYSYEDFFEGYRPDPEFDGARFVLRAGPLRQIAEQARLDPERTYVLVIDEINRGNLAKIFGELYFLLEYRDQEIGLLYGHTEKGTSKPTAFRLPANVYFIGTMNTSDRSIALLDAAMRRRFAFVELHPDRPPVSTMFQSWTQDKPMGQELKALLPVLNARIEEAAARIGPSYLMVEGMDEARLAEIWRYEILPLLEEHHFGDGTNVEHRYGLDALRGKTASTISDAGSADSDG